MTRRLHPLALAVLLVTGLGALSCDHQESGVEQPAATADAAALSPAELGRLGARIDRQPKKAGEILQEAGLTWEGFEAAVRAVSADPEKAKAYSAAFVAAGGKSPTAATDEAPPG